MSNQLIEQAHAKMNAINATDPQMIETTEGPRPRELVMAERLEVWVRRLQPHASVPLLLAARSQHLGRFRLPRSEYPEGRIAYLKWRKDQSKAHAALAREILQEVGFDQATIEAVVRINQKQGLKAGTDMQVMEDALCLSFLQHEYAEFSQKHDDAKVIDIVKKTWAKMSTEAHDLALQLPFEGRPLDLIKQALA